MEELVWEDGQELSLGLLCLGVHGTPKWSKRSVQWKELDLKREPQSGDPLSKGDKREIEEVGRTRVRRNNMVISSQL